MDLISYKLAVTQAELEVARRAREGGPVPAAARGEPPAYRGGPVWTALRRRIGGGIVRVGRAMAGRAEPAYGSEHVGDACRG